MVTMPVARTKAGPARSATKKRRVRKRIFIFPHIGAHPARGQRPPERLRHGGYALT
jgi:hypothetical protein